MERTVGIAIGLVLVLAGISILVLTTQSLLRSERPSRCAPTVCDAVPFGAITCVNATQGVRCARDGAGCPVVAPACDDGCVDGVCTGAGG